MIGDDGKGARGVVAALMIAAATLTAGCAGSTRQPATVSSGSSGASVAAPPPGSSSAGPPTTTPEPTAAYRSLGDTKRPEWMSALPDGVSLARLSLPGTHDTMAFHGDKAGPAVVTQQSFPLGCTGSDATCISRHSLRAQLDSGIRVLDIRVRRDEDGALALQHGSFYQDAHFDDVLTVVDQFLADHPRETVLMRVKAECDNSGKAFHCDDAGKVPPDLALIDHYLSAHPRVWQPSATGRADPPALGQVRGELVLWQFDNIAHGADRGLPVDIQDDWENPTVDAKWAAVTTQLGKAATGDPGTFYVNFLSASGVPDPARVPERYARDENVRALDYLRGTSTGPTGALMMDFPGNDLMSEIVRRNPG
ncbi:phosphatidylinositol-specific phospholipase C [Nocardia sp. alder85J]|uniref:phosphatidylinositol-specific phospholipase C n=1 Tax=Nocardia sp. alder85J TaxID=2862949 RepID=UPI001CD6F1A1|nr:phosphatidylinositol-specific phospholipase C [Nocardia sp. alder85J]MCX4097486.1 phosphatidylinositol-specific phospholipase C [Nocardia sp. alder85J]